MKVVVAGGTGLIGAPLVVALAEGGHEVRLLTRRKMEPAVDLPGTMIPFVWDGTSVPEGVVDGADAIVNLAGESIGGGRWTRRRKARIIGSRVAATGAIVRAIRSASRKPAVFINGSAVGFYGSVPSGEVQEDAPRGSGFLAETVEQWEQEAFAARELGVRVVAIRTGVVLSREGGILARMRVPFRLFVGGPPGSGKQWLSWIHLEDAIDGILHCLERAELEGPVNLVAPDARSMVEFCATMGRAMHRPSWLAVPSPVIRILFGEMAGIILEGQRAVPARLLASGFRFRYPRLLTSLIDLLND